MEKSWRPLGLFYKENKLTPALSSMFDDKAEMKTSLQYFWFGFVH
jgi:hypothetical protein